MSAIKSKPERKRLPKAYNLTDLQRMHIPTIPFSGEWQDALGNPAETGVWIVWGNSGSGKTAFAIQLLREFARLGYRTALNSLEQGRSLSLRTALERFGIDTVRDRVSVLSEDLGTLSCRLDKRNPYQIVVIDSLQYTGIDYRAYKAFKEQHANKLIIFISHADGGMPEGRTGKKIMYDAEMKIIVHGYRAMSKGRFISETGAYYTVWEEGATRFWLDATSASK